MKLKITKALTTTFLFILLLTIMVNFNAEAETSITIKYLTASVGENYDKIGINYHCSSNNSYLIYGTSTKDNEIVFPIKITPSSTLWGMEQLNNDTKSGMPERYVCKANLTGLSPNTTYYYQVICGTTKSNIQSFTTTNNDNSKKTFYFLTDIQSSGTGFKNAEKLLQSMEKATINSPANLVVMTGDQVDRGGYEVQWEDYYKYVTSLQKYTQATIPGNHEYYFSNASSYVSNEIYNQFYNNPLNGPSDRLGSSYYFKWGQILFIMLDTVKKDYSITLQRKWFKEVINNNPSQWIIVGSHPGCYATGAYESDSNYMRNNWLKTFEECQVDLALNGHEHVYARVNNSYDGETNELQGITYLAGGAAGLKNYSSNIKQNLLEQFTYYETSNNTGVAITIDQDTLTCIRYNNEGNEIDRFSLNAKRPSEITTITDEEILNSFTINHKDETNEVTLLWNKNLYGNVKNFKVSCDNYIVPFEYTLLTNNLNYHIWDDFSTKFNYTFKIDITKVDGSTLVKELTLNLNPKLLDYKIIYNL